MKLNPNGTNLYRGPEADHDSEAIDLLAQVAPPKPTFDIKEAAAHIEWDRSQKPTDPTEAQAQRMGDVSANPVVLVPPIVEFAPDADVLALIEAAKAELARREEAAKVQRNRPSWDEVWMGVVDLMAERATCPRLHVGSVAVRDNQLLVSAYNGAPRNLPHCDDVGCDMRGGHCVRAVHAEQNIVAQAAYRGVSLDGATLYTRHGFCVRCANLLIQAGIAEVVYVEEYDNGTSGALDSLRAVGIVVRQIA